MTGTRHQAREWAVEFLFQHNLNPDELDRALDEFWNQPEEDPDDSALDLIRKPDRLIRTPDEKTKLFMESLVRGVINTLDEIDDRLGRQAKNWAIDRMGGIDRAVMRLAIYEMLYCNDIPPVVSINEAVEIAKDYSNEESGKFVNGILDNVLQQLSRPARSPNQ